VLVISRVCPRAIYKVTKLLVGWAEHSNQGDNLSFLHIHSWRGSAVGEEKEVIPIEKLSEQSGTNARKGDQVASLRLYKNRRSKPERICHVSAHRRTTGLSQRQGEVAMTFRVPFLKKLVQLSRDMRDW